MENNFSKNLKHIREIKKISQQDIADKIGVDRSTIGYWENGKADPTMLNVMKLAETLNVDIISLIGGDIIFDNAELVDINTDTVQIPVLGVIKAGIPIEAQEDILEYIDIPRDWLRGGKTFYGLKISGDSMYPEYKENDIVVFEQCHGLDNSYNKKDCCVMVNCTECTFKRVLIKDNGISLQPYNNNYDMMDFTSQEVEELPVYVAGIAVETRRRKKYE